MSEILLIDIGGTNIRYAYSDGNLESLTGTNKIKLSCIKGFDNILEDLTGQKEISSLVISVAGPKINGSITMTNRDFTINEAELKNKFQFESCHLLNDWESIGYSLSTFKESDVSIIKPGIEFNSNSFFIGPGTGLGAALLIGDKNVIPTEIGNTTGLTKALLRNYNIDNDDHLRHLKYKYKNTNHGFFLIDNIWFIAPYQKQLMSKKQIKNFKDISFNKIEIDKKKEVNFKDINGILGFGWSHGSYGKSISQKGAWTEGNNSFLIFDNTKENINYLDLEISKIVSDNKNPLIVNVYVNRKLIKKLKFLDGINDYVMNLEQKYSDA